LIIGALLVRDASLSREVGNAVADAADANRRATALTERLNEERRAANAARQALTEARAAPPATDSLALVLLPETRGTGPVPTIAVSDNTAVVVLDLRIEGGQTTSYDVALKNPATNGILWRGHVAGGPRSTTPPLVPVQLPARLLRSQHYALDLFEDRDAGGAAFVASYAFEVVRR